LAKLSGVPSGAHLAKPSGWTPQRELRPPRWCPSNPARVPVIQPASRPSGHHSQPEGHHRGGPCLICGAQPAEPRGWTPQRRPQPPRGCPSSPANTPNQPRSKPAIQPFSRPAAQPGSQQPDIQPEGTRGQTSSQEESDASQPDFQPGGIRDTTPTGQWRYGRKDHTRCPPANYPPTRRQGTRMGTDR